MIVTEYCDQCGCLLSENSPEGLCPKCLISAVLTISGSLPNHDLPHASTGLRRVADYEILCEIASGGMGIVYKARQTSLNRIVALKMLPFGRFTRDSFVHRFRAEAQAAAKLRHPNIVAIHEVGEHEGQPYFSMDFIDGLTLAEVIRDQPLGPQRAARLLRTVAEAVHHAHQNGILHRDLKPSNILIDALDQPHVTDFGLAKNLQRDSDLTLSGQALGSPNYIPPEQINGNHDRTGPPSDVYSLGAIFYHLMTGRPPFVGETLTATLHQVTAVEPVAPRLLNPSIPRDLETICLKCLEKEPSRRYATAEELAQELARWQVDEPIRARSTTKLERLWRWCRRRPALAAAGILIVLLVLGLGIGLTALRFRTREARTQRVHSFLENARALRASERAGRREQALAAVKSASNLHPDPADLSELRDEAIACLALLDLRRGKTWNHPRPEVIFNNAQTAYAQITNDRQISLHQLNGGKTITLVAEASPVGYLGTFSPDDRFLTFQDKSGNICLWDLPEGRIKARIANARATAFTGDSLSLGISFAGAGNNYALLSLLDFRQETICILPHPFIALAFAPTGDWFIGLDSEHNSIERRAKNTGQILGSWPTPRDPTCIAVSRDGRLIAAGNSEGRLAIWTSQSGSPVSLSPRHAERITSIAFNQQGDILGSLSWDAMLHLTDTRSGAELLTMPAGGDKLSFRADDRQIAHGLHPFEFNLIEVLPSPILRTFRSPNEQGGLWCITFSEDGQYVATGEASGVRFWDGASGEAIAFIPVANPRSVFFEPGNHAVVTSGQSGLLRWRLSANGSTLSAGRAEQLLSGVFTSASASADQKIIAVADTPNDRAVIFRHANNRSPIHLGPHHGLEFIALSPNGELVATGTQHYKDVCVWSVVSSKLLATLPAPHGARVQFSQEGHLLAVSGEETILYDTTTWKPALHPQLKGVTEFSTPIAFNESAGLFVLATHLRDYQLFDLKTGKRLAVLSPPPFLSSGMPAFSPDGKFLAAAAGTSDLQLWDIQALRRQLSSLGLDW